MKMAMALVSTTAAPTILASSQAPASRPLVSRRPNAHMPPASAAKTMTAYSPASGPNSAMKSAAMPTLVVEVGSAMTIPLVPELNDGALTGGLRLALGQGDDRAVRQYDATGGQRGIELQRLFEVGRRRAQVAINNRVEGVVLECAHLHQMSSTVMRARPTMSAMAQCAVRR